jgi:hypothetical protein
MHPQLQLLADEFHFATARLHALARSVPEDRWPTRRDPARWSVAECVAHLNLTSAAYEPILREALARDARSFAGAQDRPATPFTGRYRRDLFGWLLWKSQPPPVRIRTKTIAAFIPEATGPRDLLVAEFEKWQGMQLGCLERADGLPLNDIKVVSPFNAKLRYNLYSCFSILPAHQHRHLWQGEQVWR